eukprot:3255624-Pyramimonas_sp.AAC.1
MSSLIAVAQLPPRSICARPHLRGWGPEPRQNLEVSDGLRLHLERVVPTACRAATTRAALRRDSSPTSPVNNAPALWDNWGNPKASRQCFTALDVMCGRLNSVRPVGAVASSRRMIRAAIS